jgi:hypothetical protein
MESMDELQKCQELFEQDLEEQRRTIDEAVAAMGKARWRKSQI